MVWKSVGPLSRDRWFESAFSTGESVANRFPKRRMRLTVNAEKTRICKVPGMAEWLGCWRPDPPPKVRIHLPPARSSAESAKTSVPKRRSPVCWQCAEAAAQLHCRPLSPLPYLAGPIYSAIAEH